MPVGMKEQRARDLAAQIEAEDKRVQAIVQRCDHEYYTGKTWKVIAVLKGRGLIHCCYQPKYWTSIQVAWNELCREENVR